MKILILAFLLFLLLRFLGRALVGPVRWSHSMRRPDPEKDISDRTVVLPPESDSKKDHKT